MHILDSFRVPALTLALTAASLGCDPAQPGDDERSASTVYEQLDVDIAEDMSRFVFDEAPLLENGFPGYGNTFITQGYVYPAGYLDDHPGVNPDGSPADPEAVLGEWTCRGTLIGDGAATQTGPWVITTQMIALYEEPGYEPQKASGFANIVTDGYEIADVGREIDRPVTGGTGRFVGASGTLSQVMLGFNESEGVNLRQSFDLRLPESAEL